MKIAIALLLILYHTQNVNTFPIFDGVVHKIKEFGASLMSTLRTIKNKMNVFLKQRNPNEKKKFRARDQIEERTRRVLSDFVEEESTTDTITEIPQLISFKSEVTAMMSTPQLAKYHGKRIESHVVITGDGYLLTIHRLMKPFDQPLADKLHNPTVLLHHGLLGSSADWILLGKEKSLPYILSDLGYDVWMANARGNIYSRGHVSENVESVKYWKFSWQEIGKYDLSAVVDYIRKLKNSNETINFIGHSMGATALLVLLSTTPRYNEYFRMGILLAPLAYMSNVEGT